MATELGELIVKLSVDLADAKKKISEMESKVSDVSQGLEKFGFGVSGIGSKLKTLVNPLTLAAVGVAAVTSAVVASVKVVADYGEELLRVSKQSGINVESLARLKYAAEQEEASLQSLTTGLKFLQKHMAEVGDLRSPQERLLQLADQMAKTENPTKRAELAFKNFGRAGYDLIPFLSTGRAHIEQLGNEAERLGLVINEETAVAADDFHDNLAKLKMAILGVAISIAKDLLPPLVTLVGHTADFVVHVKSVVDRVKEWAVEIYTLAKATRSLGSALALFGLSKFNKEVKQNVEDLKRSVQGTEDLTGAVKKQSGAVRQLSVDWAKMEKVAVAAAMKATGDHRSEYLKRMDAARESFENTATFHQQLMVKMAEQTRSWSSVFVGTIGNLKDEFARGMADFIVNGGSFKDKMEEIGRNVLQFFVEQVIAQMLAKWIAYLAAKVTANATADAAIMASNAATGSVGATGGLGAGLGAGLAGLGGAGLLYADFQSGKKEGKSDLQSGIETGLWNITGGNTGHKLVKNLKKKLSGGLIKEPSLVLGLKSGDAALAAEEGQPEAIVPFRDMGITPQEGRNRLMGLSKGGGGGSIIVNIIGTFLEADAARWDKLVRQNIVPPLQRMRLKTVGSQI
ncbi:MAG: hypothetical protein HY548_04470 [Elusimicrobia bacterium]|nr:hypothetical protein [Elusimicrobiota bacterium]